MRLALPLLAALLAACSTVPAAAPEGAPFAYLESSQRGIVSRNALPLRVRRPQGFRVTPVSSRTATFGDHPYEVSLAALLSDEGAVMVHAERVADSSGASNYDDLPLAGWPDERFRVRTMCAAIPAEAVAGEHDLAFLARNGWDPVGSLALEQYLATTTDHNQEVVVSLAVRVADCARSEENAARLRALRNRLTVSRG
jgi:hypothetical protein